MIPRDLSLASGARAHCTTVAPLDAPSPEPLRSVIVVVVVVLVGVVGGSEFIVPQVHSEYQRRQLLVTSQLRIAL